MDPSQSNLLPRQEGNGGTTSVPRTGIVILPDPATSTGGYPSTTATNTSPSQTSAQVTVTSPMDMATSSPSSSAKATSHSHNNGGLIGGVVGGVLGAVVIMILVFLLCRRRRKQRQQAHEQRLNGNWKTMYTEDGTSSPSNGPNNSNHNAHAPSTTETPVTSSDTPDSATQLLERSRDASTAGSNTESTNMTLDNNTYNSIVPQIAITSQVPELPASSPGQGHSGFTPELPDTGFYRQRAELATHPQTELINVPPNLRRNNRSPPRYGMIQNDPCLDSSPYAVHGGNNNNAGDGNGNGGDDDKRLIELNLYQPVSVRPPRNPAPVMRLAVPVDGRVIQVQDRRVNRDVEGQQRENNNTDNNTDNNSYQDGRLEYLSMI